MAEKQKYNFGHRDRRRVDPNKVKKREDILGSGTYKVVYSARIEGDDKEYALSTFKDNFDAKDTKIEFTFAYELAQSGIASVPTYIKTSEKAEFLPTERLLADNITLSKGAQFLTPKLICGKEMIGILGYRVFFTKLRELYSKLINITKTVYTDTKVGNVCYDPISKQIKIVDVDKNFFAKLPHDMTSKKEDIEIWINYMIFQTWVVEHISGKNPTLTLADAGLTEEDVLLMLNILIVTQPHFESMIMTPVGNLCWYSRRKFKAENVENDFNDNGPEDMLKFIMNGNPNPNVDSDTDSPFNGRGRKRRTMRRKQLRIIKTRKNGKKGKKGKK